ncbi:MAG: HlyD family efflux transporter periplasmic adaptor subunit, partial [Bacillota bacterium]
PLFKIIDNLVPLRMVVTIKSSKLDEPLAVGDSVQVMYQDQILGEAECESVWSGKDRQTAILSLDSFNEALLEQRKIEVDCITHIYRGLIIPEKALVKNRAGDAVYIVDKGKVQLCALKVLTVRDGKAVVEGLQPGDTIVTTPGLVSDGMVYR